MRKCHDLCVAITGLSSETLGTIASIAWHLDMIVEEVLCDNGSLELKTDVAIETN